MKVKFYYKAKKYILTGTLIKVLSNGSCEIETKKGGKYTVEKGDVINYSKIIT